MLEDKRGHRDRQYLVTISIDLSAGLLGNGMVSIHDTEKGNDQKEQTRGTDHEVVIPGNKCSNRHSSIAMVGSSVTLSTL